MRIDELDDLRPCFPSRLPVGRELGFFPFRRNWCETVHAWAVRSAAVEVKRAKVGNCEVRDTALNRVLSVQYLTPLYCVVVDFSVRVLAYCYFSKCFKRAERKVCRLFDGLRAVDEKNVVVCQIYKVCRTLICFFSSGALQAFGPKASLPGAAFLRKILPHI